MKACQWKVIACSLALLAAGCGDSVSVDSGRMQVSAAARTAASSAGQAAALASDCSPSANPAAAPSDCANPIAARIGAGTRSINVTADVSTGNHTREVIEAEDVRRFRMHGFNHFRVFLPVRLAMPGLATDATIAAFHQALAADLEAWLGEGMGVTLTPFIAEADMPNILGTAAGRVAFSNFLGDLAARYGHHPSDLLSFEVLNEPHSITGSVGSDCAFPACSPPIWRDLQLGFVSAIRKSAPGHTVIVSAADWNNPPALLRFVPYDDPNLIYAFHYYPAQVFVAQSAWLPEHGLRYPSCLPGNAATAGAIRDSGQAAAARQYAEGGWSRERMLDELAQLADWAERNGVRVFANEIGAFPLDLESRTRWVRDQRLALEQLRIPWTVWSVFDYYTRGWVHGDRVPVAELLRGVGGMPWMYPDPSCGAQPAARVDLSATIEPGSTEFRIAVGNAGPDTATNVEARIGLLEHEVIGAGADQGRCLVSRGHVECRLGDLPAGASVQIRVSTAADDHAGSAAQVFVVSDDRELDDTDNYAVNALPDLDGDGLSERLDADRDGDGLADWFEAEWGTARNDPGDQLLDSDQDGYSNLAEAQARSPTLPFGSNPFDAASVPPQPAGALSAEVGPLERISTSPARWAVRVTLRNLGAAVAQNCSLAPLHPQPFFYRFHPIDAARGAVDGPPFQARSVPGSGAQDFLVTVDGAVPGFLDSVPLRLACQNGQATVAAVKGCTAAPGFGPLRRLSEALCERFGSRPG